MGADTKEVHRSIQILVPVFNEEGSIDTFFRGIAPTIAAVTDRYSGLRFEFLFVNDGSREPIVECLHDQAAVNPQQRSSGPSFVGEFSPGRR